MSTFRNRELLKLKKKKKIPHSLLAFLKGEGELGAEVLHLHDGASAAPRGDQEGSRSCAPTLTGLPFPLQSVLTLSSTEFIDGPRFDRCRQMPPFLHL